jgi:putative copper resistance protein D
MGDVPLTEALGMLPQVLTETGFGHSALAAMAVAALLLVTPPGRWWPVRGALLLVFALARASMSHAAEHGLLSAAVAIEWLHLVVIGVWFGAVALGGWIVLGQAVRAGGALGPYLSQLSRGATVALGLIVASGVFNTWQRMDSPSQFIDSAYGLALTAKLALFGVAVLLGAYNRYIGFPTLARSEGGHALMVLRVESVVLLGAMAAAAVLTAQAPPG